MRPGPKKRFYGTGRRLGNGRPQGNTLSQVARNVVGAAAGYGIGKAGAAVARAIRTRVPLSFTKTKTKQKRKIRFNRPIISGSHGSKSSFFKVHRPTPQIKTIMRMYKPRRKKTIMPGTRSTAGYGRQATWGWEYANYAFFDDMQADALLHFEQNVPHTMAPAQNNTVRQLIGNIWGNISFSNACPGIQYVTIYDYHCKRDVYDFNLNLNEDGLLDPAISAWEAGVRNQEGASTTVQIPFSQDVLGARPTDSALFKQHYEIDKVTEVVLGPGDVHKHSFFVGVNKLMPIRPEGLQAVATKYDIGGFGRGIIVVSRGQPAAEVNQVTGFPVSNSKVSTMSPDLLIIKELNWTYGSALSTAKFQRTYDNIDHAPGAGNTFAVLNQDGDVKIDLDI